MARNEMKLLFKAGKGRAREVLCGKSLKWFQDNGAVSLVANEEHITALGTVLNVCVLIRTGRYNCPLLYLLPCLFIS